MPLAIWGVLCRLVNNSYFGGEPFMGLVLNLLLIGLVMVGWYALTQHKPKLLKHVAVKVRSEKDVAHRQPHH